MRTVRTLGKPAEKDELRKCRVVRIEIKEVIETEGKYLSHEREELRQFLALKSAMGFPTANGFGKEIKQNLSLHLAKERCNKRRVHRDVR